MFYFNILYDLYIHKLNIEKAVNEHNNYYNIIVLLNNTIIITI